MEEHDCKCGCLALSKLRELTKTGPPRPGLVPQSGDPEHPGRWVRPEDADKEPEVFAPSGALKEPWQMTRDERIDREISRGIAQWQNQEGSSVSMVRRTPKGVVFSDGKFLPFKRLQFVYDQERAIRQALSEGRPVPSEVLADFPGLAQEGNRGKMMKTHVTQALGTLVKNLELQGLTKGLNGLIAKGAPPTDAVPLEQIKGDLARAGHPVKRAIALDAQNRRLFFIDNADTYLFAEYGSPESGFSLGRVGSQSEVAKDYDPVDLEPEPRSDVDTEHDEEKQGDDPGFVPSGTPGVKPTDADGRGFGKELQASLDKVCGCLKDQGR